MENVMINVNDVKKELYKSKAIAKISHYTSGNIYYTVELSDGVYQFPISITENGTLVAIETMAKARVIELEKKLDITLVANKEPNIAEEAIKKEIDIINGELEKMTRLSSDLGTTSFESEMKGSDLNRWIAKAINSNDFIKIR